MKPRDKHRLELLEEAYHHADLLHAALHLLRENRFMKLDEEYAQATAIRKLMAGALDEMYDKDA